MHRACKDIFSSFLRAHNIVLKSKWFVYGLPTSIIMNYLDLYASLKLQICYNYCKPGEESDLTGLRIVWRCALCPYNGGVADHYWSHWSYIYIDPYRCSLYTGFSEDCSPCGGAANPYGYPTYKDCKMWPHSRPHWWLPHSRMECYRILVGIHMSTLARLKSLILNS